MFGKIVFIGTSIDSVRLFHETKSGEKEKEARILRVEALKTQRARLRLAARTEAKEAEEARLREKRLFREERAEREEERQRKLAHEAFEAEQAAKNRRLKEVEASTGLGGVLPNPDEVARRAVIAREIAELFGPREP